MRFYELAKRHGAVSDEAAVKAVSTGGSHQWEEDPVVFLRLDETRYHSSVAMGEKKKKDPRYAGTLVVTGINLVTGLPVTIYCPTYLRLDLERYVPYTPGERRQLREWAFNSHNPEEDVPAWLNEYADKVLNAYSDRVVAVAWKGVKTTDDGNEANVFDCYVMSGVPVDRVDWRAMRAEWMAELGTKTPVREASDPAANL